MNALGKILTGELRNKADAIVAKYETKRASILEILRLIMETHGYITLEAEEAVGEYLQIPIIDVHEVVSFYTLYYTKPKAKNRFNICRTLTCSMLGGIEILKYLEKKLGVKEGEMSSDGEVSIHTVECLGACEIAPMMQVNDCDYVGPLTQAKIDDLVQGLKRGK